jgi:hypothetical protein
MRSRSACASASLSDINLDGSAVTPRPAMVVNFRSFDTLCGEPVRCPVVVADTTPQQGQGTHGSFSRAETWNFMALAGPDFKSGFIDTAPVSNADIGRMVAAIMQLDFKGKGVLTGRVLTEAMRGGVMPDVKAWSVVSEPAADGPRTVLDVQARRHRWLSRPHPWAFTRYNHLRPMNSAMGQRGANRSNRLCHLCVRSCPTPDVPG